MRGKQCRPSGDWDIPSRTTSWGAALAISVSANRMEPVRGRVSAEIERSVVDLPAPLEPINVTHSPSWTSSAMPLSASMFP
jgi:hypothetical protein